MEGLLRLLTAEIVQVSRTPRCWALPTHGRSASEKRQGTKSREAEHRRCSGRYAVDLSEAPLLRNRLSLEDSLRDPLVPLSFRAASGFYERLKNSDLRTEKYFKRDLRGYVAQARRID